MQQNGPGMSQELQADVTREARGMDPSSPTQMEQGYNTRLPPFFFRPTPPRLSPGRYTSFYLPEIELICMQSHR